MISKVLVSSDVSKRESYIVQILQDLKVKEEHPDVLFLREEKLGVEEGKRIREFLSIKPYQAQGRVIAVLNAHKLTLDAQNSLLKSIEEPPEEASIILGVNSEADLLKTILSRCELVVLDSIATLQNDTHDIEEIQGMSIEERFVYVEKLEDKDGFLKALALYFRGKLPESSSYLEKVIQAQEWKNQNVQGRAILEYLMLEMPS